MWYRKADIPEYNVMHGTGNVESIRSKGFVCDYLGKGVEQYGPGFYFTTKKETAERYTKKIDVREESKIGGENAPGVIHAIVTLNNPITKVHGIESNAFEIYPKLNYRQSKQMVKLAVDLQGLDILTDFDDIDYYGANQVIEKTAKLFAGLSSAQLMYDLFSNRMSDALKFINRTFGNDGVVIDYGDEKWIVAWFPEQIKIV